MKGKNNFGALRLVFAVLVILSHSYELIDGNRSREILTDIFGTLSFGQFGVAGFFLISGYLITKSLQDTPTATEYMLKRILRIYPGFMTAYLVDIIISPFVGGPLSTLYDPETLKNMMLLRQPEVAGVFADTRYAVLNGSMWTISYEFVCYGLLLTVGALGLLSSRFAMTVSIGMLLILHRFSDLSFLGVPSGFAVIFGSDGIGFTSIFGVGSLFYLYRDSIRYDGRIAVAAALGLIILMFSSIAEIALAILGGYVLFWFALKVKCPALAQVGHNVDLSYGIYLYAWPVQELLIWLNPGMSPWFVFTAATVVAGVCAYGSWRCVEKPCLNLKTNLLPLILAKNVEVAVFPVETREK